MKSSCHSEPDSKIRTPYPKKLIKDKINQGEKRSTNVIQSQQTKKKSDKTSRKKIDLELYQSKKNPLKMLIKKF